MHEKYKNKNKCIIINKYYRLIIQIFFFVIIKKVLTECPRDKPILISENCNLQYCTKEQFNSKTCIINNSIIKTQWLNNLIKIGVLKYRYINFASYSNGDMVIEATSYPEEAKRYFYGLKRNGRPLFKNKNNNTNETPYYMIETNKFNNYKGKYESKSIIIKSSETGENNGKEYFLSIPSLDNYAELFDFENDKIYFKDLLSFSKHQYVKTYKHSLFLYSNESNQYYYFFGFITDTAKNYNNEPKIIFQKHIFEDIPEFKNQNTGSEDLQTISNTFGKIITCFQTYRKLLICFYLIRTDKLYFNIRKYGEGFTDPIDYQIESNIDINAIYFKCIHLKDEIGVFSYFKSINNTNYPYLLFKEFNIETNSFENYLPDKYVNSEIILNQRDDFFGALLMNNIIRINENKICFCTIPSNKETIYIILINFFGNKQIKIRYYSIQIYPLYHYKILFESTIHNYNNYIAFAASYCPNQKCNDNNDEHYVGLMVFSYPNSTDNEFNLENHLSENNINIKDIEIDLKKNLIFQNNIFGLILSNVLIEEVINCNELKFVLSKDGNIEILGGAFLDLDENINIRLREINSSFLNCKIQYALVATEPDLNIYDTYPEFTQGDDDNEESFQKTKYYGRSTYYTIKSNNNLTTNCKNNCDLCIDDDNKYCISCKYNSSLNIENGIKIKKCDDKTIDETTELTNYLTIDYITEISHSPLTTQITYDYLSNEYTETTDDKKTERNSNEISEENTNKISDENTEYNIKETQKSDKIEEGIEIICSDEDILNNMCKESIIDEKQLNDLNNKIKQNYLNDEYNGENNIVETKNAVFQVTNLDNQTNSNNKEISIIDLGECTKILKNFYKIPEKESLIVYKTDIKTSNYVQTYVQYEIYNPLNLERLDLSICENTEITINTKINLDNSTISLYNSLKESGYDLFNQTDSFYTNICSLYTSDNGTDITLLDRNTEIFEKKGNISLCQIGCKLNNFNTKIKRVICECPPQINEIEAIFNFSDDKFILQMLRDSFLTNIKNSNFLVLKCYKLAFDTTSLTKNIGRIFMTIIVGIAIILLLNCIFNDFKRIDTYILIILNNNNIKNKKKKIKFNETVKKPNIYKNGTFQRRTRKFRTTIVKLNPIKKKNSIIPNLIDKNNNLSSFENILNLKSNIVTENLKIKRRQKKFGTNINNSNSISNILKLNNSQFKKIKDKNNKTRNNKNIISRELSNTNNNGLNNIGSNDNLVINKLQSLNDYELNTLEYEDALELDKRTYFQYYHSLLKKKHLLLFTFCPAKDYNLFSLKISLFLVNFSLYFAMNCFFFSDDTMHKIYIDNGAYRIIYQLPQIIYTILISGFSNRILKLLSLSERDFIELKHEKNYTTMVSKSKTVKRCLVIKFVIFFILNFLLLFFFWYFISCFCAVFPKTQIILIIDSFLSFGTTLIYPFFLNLIPGILRIPSLKSTKKDKRCLYMTGRLLSFV